MSTKKIIITQEEWQSNFTKPAVLEISKIVLAEERKMGPDCSGVLYSGFVAGMITAAITNSLNHFVDICRSLPENEREKAVYAEFSKLKGKLEAAVAAGFQASMSLVVGRPVEYYCKVSVVPPAVNKKPC